MRLVWPFLLGLVAAMGCVPTLEYRCENEAQCVEAGRVGVCQDTQRCSFPDENCLSGQRYAKYGGALGGSCVPVGGGTGTDSDGTSATSGPTDGSTSATGTTGPGNTGEPADWRFVRPITVVATEDLTDHQVSVTLSVADFDYAATAPDGDDLRFATSLDRSEFDLPHWIHSWDEQGDSRIWIRVPEASATTPSTIYMFYGNPAATSSSHFESTFPNAFISRESAAIGGSQTFDWFEVRPDHTLDVANEDPLVVLARVVIVDGILDATGAGHAGGDTSPSPGAGPGGGGTSTNAGAGGGGYGGVGGLGGYDMNDGPGAGGMEYGDPSNMSSAMGSGGGGTDLRAGGNGGGAVTLQGRVVEVSGTVLADGEEGEGQGTDNERGGGGGAGGSVSILGLDVVADGTFSARGGNGGNQVATVTMNDGGGGGAGGRIKIWYGTAAPSVGSIDVLGGPGGLHGDAASGAPGGIGTEHVGAGFVDLSETTVGTEMTL